MTDFQLPIFLLVVGGLVVFLISLKRKDEKVAVLYGYPAYRKTWLTIYHYRDSDRWIFEWDDLFDSGRPKSWGDIRQCLMYEDARHGATSEEFKQAWAMLRRRGLL
jgi:hypothetical protein